MTWPWMAGAAAAAVVLAIGAAVVMRTVPAAVEPARARAESERIIADAKRVLVVAAHPDDVEWYAGATIARLVDAGAEITVVMATDGERGRGPKPGLAVTRRDEQIEAARRLSPAIEVIFVGLPDGGLARSGQLLEARVREIWQQVDPILVLAFDPEKPQLPYIHRDHMAAGSAALRLWRDLQSAAALWLFHTRRPDVFVDAGTQGMERKLDALSAHETQMAGHGGDWILRTQARRLGALLDVEYAEGFRDGGAGEDGRAQGVR